MDTPPLSIVVCACSMKRYADLVDLLSSIKAQTFKNFETVLVIDGNKELHDKIKDYLSLNSVQNTKLILNPEQRGLSHCRNTGIMNASGEIIAFVDDDAVLYLGWAGAVINSFDLEQIGGASGEIEPAWESQEMTWFPRELHWLISCSYIMTPTVKQEVERGFGTNMAFRRTALLESGMFDTSLGVVAGKKWVGGEDTLMFLNVRKAGKTVIFNPEMRIKHKIYKDRLKLKNIIKRAYGGGYSVALLKKQERYKVTNSTENTYLKKLLFEFYPQKLKELIKKPRVITRQMGAVSVVIVSEGMGYIHGFLIG